MKFIKTMEQFLFEQKQQEVKSIISKLFSNLLFEQEVSFSKDLVDLFHEIGNKNQITQFILNHLQNNKLDLDTDLKNVEYVDVHPEKQDMFLVTYTKPDGATVTQEKKIGRFTNSLLKALKSAPQITPTDIESFVKDVFGERTGVDETYTFKLVSGKDIKKYYLEDRSECLSGGLGGSCMRHKSTQSFINFYVQNSPEKVNLLVKLNPKTDKIVGRALVWNLDSGKKYLDRIYVTDDKYIQEFINYATKNLGVEQFHKGNDTDRGKTVTIPNFFVKPPKTMPYMDTFQYGVREDDDLVLYSELPDVEFTKLTQVDGFYEKLKNRKLVMLKIYNKIKEKIKKKIKTDKDGSVYYDGDIDLTHLDLTSLEILKDLNIKYITGDFNCSNNKLTSLEFTPQEVGGGFNCSNNRLKSLQFAPSKVKGTFNCSNNQLTMLKGSPQVVVEDFICSSNQLTSLEFAPQKVGGDFYCNNNNLTSLEFAPQKVGGDFYCNNNNLTSLEFAPQEVGGGFDCSSNKLTSLEFAPQKVGGSFSCSSNKLTSLEFAPRVVDGSFDCSYNKLTSLEFAPRVVDGSFDCSYNKLTSLEGSPQIVGESFICSNNNLTSLEFAPSEVKWNFDCSSNKLTSLEFAPQIVGGDFNCILNNITTLKGSPRKVGKYFMCFKNNLTSLEFAPSEVGSGFYCSENPLQLKEVEKLKQRVDYLVIYTI